MVKSSSITKQPPNLHYLETEMGNHSLPTIDEVKTQTSILSGGALSKSSSSTNNKYSGRNKRTIALIVILVTIIALVVGFTVAIVQNHKSQEVSSNTSDVNDDEDGNDDNDGNDDGNNVNGNRLQQLHAFLVSGSISSKQDLTDPTKPQYSAAYWFANEDVYEMDIPSKYTSFDENYDIVQRYVLAVLYYALDGTNWDDDLSFLSDAEVCDWNRGIELSSPPPGTDDTEFDFGISCYDEESGQYLNDIVTYIFMPTNGASGSLPSEIGLLEGLVHLSLYNNGITGSIPESMSQLMNLNYWAMESNNISGKIPSWINQLPELTYLALGDNQLTGPLPSFVDSNIQELSLDENYLKGSIDSLKDATLLRIVYLNDNQLTGRFSTDTWPDLDELDIVDLSDNQLTGSFPSTFYYVSQIDLSRNNLNGGMDPIDDINEEYTMTYLSLSDNEMIGSLPSNIGDLVNLITFDVSENNFDGSIPSTIVDLTELEQLYLSRNDFTAGTIPDLRYCENLEELSLASTNRIDTSFPSWIGTSTQSLTLLDLHDNKIGGTIPTDLGLLEDLETLVLNDNYLDGSIPSELGDLEYLVFVSFQRNQLKGDAEALCNGASDNLDHISVDTTVTCAEGCCVVCANGDVSCDKTSKLQTGDVYIERDAYVTADDLVFDEAN